MGQIFIEYLNILKGPHLETMCMQLCTLRIGSYAPDDKWCNTSLFETAFWPAEKNVKAMNPNGAFCRYLIRYLDMQRKF